MAKKVLLSLLLLWFSGHLFSIPRLHAKSVPTVSLCACKLAPPSNLHAVRVGTTEADIAWDPVIGADGYKVKVYQKVGTNYIFLYEVNNVPTSITITGLILDYDHRVTVAGMCSNSADENNWILSPNESSLELPKIILDLDIVQVAPMPTNAGLANCVIQNGPNCNFYFSYMNGNRLWIKVKKNQGGACNIHGIRVVEDGRARLFNSSDQTGPCPTILYTENVGYQGTNLITQSYLGLTRAVIREEEGPEILEIKAFGNDGYATHISINNNLPNVYTYECYELNWFGFGPPNGGDRGEWSSTPTPNIYPINPFAENLDVIDASPGDLPVKLQLFDLSGRLETTQQYDSGQSTYSLPSADLSPGLYILRIESGGLPQTYKVVKTQN